MPTEIELKFPINPEFVRFTAFHIYIKDKKLLSEDLILDNALFKTKDYFFKKFMNTEHNYNKSYFTITFLITYKMPTTFTVVNNLLTAHLENLVSKYTKDYIDNVII
jgi:hypothetical protein